MSSATRSYASEAPGLAPRPKPERARPTRRQAAMNHRRFHDGDARAYGLRAGAVLAIRYVSPPPQPCAPSFQPSLHRPSRTGLSGSGTCRSLNRHKRPYAPSTGRGNWTRPATARLLQSPGSDTAGLDSAAVVPRPQRQRERSGSTAICLEGALAAVPSALLVVVRSGSLPSLGRCDGGRCPWAVFASVGPEDRR